jgi:hypothetical protein
LFPIDLDEIPPLRELAVLPLKDRPASFLIPPDDGRDFELIGSVGWS